MSTAASASATVARHPMCAQDAIVQAMMPAICREFAHPWRDGEPYVDPRRLRRGVLEKAACNSQPVVLF
jgi:hypothetical protein